MREIKDLIIISDIHLSVERGRGLFRADDELADFLSWIYKETTDCLVVLNGDILDFLVGENSSETITVENAKQKVKTIIEKHSEVFDGLKELANSPHHQLVILSGNHDPELSNPIVQLVVEKRLGDTNFKNNIRWVTGGYAFLTMVGDCQILIEHGDLFDDFNRVDYGELHRTTAHLSRMLGFDKYQPPPGSKIVENLSPLRQKYPWIDYIKPLSTGTFPLIWAFAEQELSPKQSRMFKDVIINGLGGGSNWFVRKIKEFIGDSPLLAEGDEEEEAFAEWRMSQIYPAPTTITNDHAIQLIRQLKKVSGKDRSFDVESPETNAFKEKYLKKYAEQKQISAVIHGHTHSAKSYVIGNSELLYLNSGTWGRLLQLPLKQDSDDVWKAFLAKLEAGVDESFNRLTFVRVNVSGDNRLVRATTNEWKQESVEELSSKHKDPATAEWKVVELSVQHWDSAIRVWKQGN